MAMAKRVFLFLAVNFLVILTVSIIMAVFGIEPYLQAQGIHYESLLVFCLIWGFGGAFISLALSRKIAKWTMGVKVISPEVQDPALSELVQTVHQLSRSAGLPKMPEVGIYESPEVNAFATGPTKSRALVAVSTGLLSRMQKDEIEGVLGHEVAHVANGDMVTMTLIQGVVNAFVMFLARVVAFAVMNLTRDRDSGESPIGGFAYYLVVWVLEAFFMIFGSMVVAWFSRYREFRADLGSAKIGGKEKMIAALERLQKTMEIEDPHAQSQAVQTMKISSKRGGFLALLASHPPLEQRIRALETSTEV